jgi:hypothetical protein
VPGKSIAAGATSTLASCRLQSHGEVSLVQRAEALFGIYWCATEQGHVIYESRLELARLVFADFDWRVNHIVAQRFLLRADIDGRPGWRFNRRDYGTPTLKSLTEPGAAPGSRRRGTRP